MVREAGMRINNCGVGTVMCGKRCLFSYTFIFLFKMQGLKRQPNELQKETMN